MKGLKEQKLAKKYNRRCGLSSLQTQSSLPVWIRRLKQVRKLESMRLLPQVGQNSRVRLQKVRKKSWRVPWSWSMVPGVSTADLWWFCFLVGEFLLQAVHCVISFVECIVSDGQRSSAKQCWRTSEGGPYVPVCFCWVNYVSCPWPQQRLDLHFTWS